MLLLTGTLCGCFTAAPEAEEKKLKIVTTIFPAYDWVREVLGEEAENAEVTMLLENGADMHSYQPTAADMVRISECGVFIYVGGESDRWIEDPPAETAKPEAIRVNMMETLGSDVKTEEIAEGMEAGGEESGEEAENDEHVWLSLRNAQTIVSRIAWALSEADKEHAAEYAANAQAYNEKLRALDEQYAQMADEAPLRTLLFGDRFPFRYLTDDYGLDYYAAFPGCSAETEASFETVIFLAQKADELGISHILTIEGSQGQIAETVARNTRNKNQTVLTLNSMQSVTLAEARDGTSYLSIAEDNLKVLKTALEDA